MLPYSHGHEAKRSSSVRGSGWPLNGTLNQVKNAPNWLIWIPGWEKGGHPGRVKWLPAISPVSFTSPHFHVRRRVKQTCLIAHCHLNLTSDRWTHPTVRYKWLAAIHCSVLQPFKPNSLGLNLNADPF